MGSWILFFWHMTDVAADPLGGTVPAAMVYHPGVQSAEVYHPGVQHVQVESSQDG